MLSNRAAVTRGVLRSPLAIPNCTQWLDASDASTITIATGVSQWNDKSGRGVNITQSTGNFQPTVISNSGMNGLSVLRFDGTNDSMSANWTRQLSGGNTFIAAADVKFANSGAYRPLLRIDADVNAFQHQASGDGTSPNKFVAFCKNSGSTQYDANSNVQVTTKGAFIAVSVVDPTALTITYYKNNRLAGLKTITGVLNSSTSTILYIGNASGGGFPGQYDVGEILIYDRVLLASECSKIATYLGHKWGVACG